MEFLLTALPYWALFSLTWFFVVLYIVREEPQYPVWLYDVIRGINQLIIVITIVVIPLLPVLLR
ncbi:hypothetical protein [Escherichia coli]|uniref:hypothetical protein n=1 Tax=Escherichia coli TaxID=562 RepID=UPI00101DA5A8|nr:hypothetical protein [Escherichia coli]